MDAPSLVTFLAVLAVAVIVVPRLLLESLGHASDGIAQLFVPPDWALGWPRGVQESDDGWGWRTPTEATRNAALAMEVAASSDRPVVVDLDGPDPDWFPDGSAVIDLDAHAVVIPVCRVTRA